METTNKTAVQISKPNALDEIATRAIAGIANASGKFDKALVMADAMNDLRAALIPKMDTFMKLQNTPLGFKTDRTEAPFYSKEVVCDALIEATIRGVEPVGNQFNIIASRCYITKEGYEYKLKGLQGFTDFKHEIGVPQSVGNGEGAIVECTATWKYNGTPDSKTSKIPVRVNKGMGVDATIGKATRKFFKRVYEQVTGATEEDDAEITPETSEHRRFEASKAANARVINPTDALATAAKEMPPQEIIEAFVTDASFSISEFLKMLVEGGHLKADHDITTFAQIPTDLAKRMVNARGPVLKALADSRGAQ
jgi:hypothetical protein